MGGVGLCGNRKDWKECFKDLLETKSKDIEARWVTEWWQGVKLRRRKKTCGVEMSCSADGASLEDQRRRGSPCSLPPTLSPGDTHPIHPILPPPSYFVFPVTKEDLVDWKQSKQNPKKKITQILTFSPGKGFIYETALSNKTNRQLRGFLKSIISFMNQSWPGVNITKM